MRMYFFIWSSGQCGQDVCFGKKPLNDEETLKLLFLFGNGCPPLVISKWILTSQFWNVRGTLKIREENYPNKQFLSRIFTNENTNGFSFIYITNCTYI